MRRLTTPRDVVSGDRNAVESSSSDDRNPNADPANGKVSKCRKESNGIQGRTSGLSAHAETCDYPFSVSYLLTGHRDRRANLDLPQEPLMQMRDLQDRDIR